MLFSEVETIHRKGMIKNNANTTMIRYEPDLRRIKDKKRLPKIVDQLRGLLSTRVFGRFDRTGAVIVALSS
jgi:hypothetical protein